MDREILFRGLSNQGKGWLYGDVVRNVEGAVAIMPPYQMNMDNTCSQNEVNPDTIGQYTGLKDKNGRQIFDGDILEYIGKRKDNMSKVYHRKVVFYEGMFSLLSKELPVYTALKDHCMEDGRSAWHVIGNIHDNPELMK